MLDLTVDPVWSRWRPVALTPAPLAPRTAPQLRAALTGAPTVQACHGGGAVGPGCFALILPGAPIAQPRQRFAGMLKFSPDKGKMAPSARPFKDEKHPVHAHKAELRKRAAARLPAGWDTSLPCVVGCAFIFPRPKSLPKRTRHLRLPKLSKPDTDNLKKAILDSLKGLLWNDDAQVWADFNVKLVGAAHEEPHTVVVFDQRPEALTGAWVALIPDTITGAVATRDPASNR